MFEDPRPPFIKTGERRYKCSPAYMAALRELTDREVTALTALLLGHSTLKTWREAERAALHQMRRRSFRRLMATLPAEEQQSLHRLQASLEQKFGRTRPIDATGELCVVLRSNGLTAVETAALLTALGIETAAADETGRKRIQNRLDRYRLRQATRQTR